jgi:pyruvate/2-oxoglutarate dehydrogenase complex dihydrolipoamide acyltransferase (E2) component
MQNTTNNGQLRQVPSNAGGLIRSTLVSGAAALAVLTIVYLPAQYGRDPTGFGAVLGLTEMGQIKQQLYAEDAADAAAPQIAIDPAVIARLDAIEAQLALMNAVIGAPPLAAPVEPAPVEAAPVEAAPAAPAEAAPETAPAEAAPAATDAAAPDAAQWRDEASYTLAPGEGIEVKLAMTEGQIAQFEWTANGAVVNFDTHGDGGGQKISYEQGRGVGEQAGSLTAAFTGNHGWFWRNRTDAPVTITLRTKGEYAELKQ